MIESEFSGDKSSRDFLHLAWIAILEAVGSYFKEGNGIKYRNKKRLKTGYVRRLEGEWQYERFGRDQKQFALDVFCSQARMMLQDTKYWRKGRWRDQTVIEGNVLEMDQLLTLLTSLRPSALRNKPAFHHKCGTRHADRG